MQNSNGAIIINSCRKNREIANKFVKEENGINSSNTYTQKGETWAIEKHYRKPEH